MRTNLIQSYLNGNTTTAQQYNSEKAARDFDVKKELANRTFIKPLPSNGRLLHPSLFDMPSVVVKDLKYDWNAFRHAVKGEANDHELGRLNDTAMKIGGLTIASYLFTKKQTPMTKAFEFIGMCTFFGAMDLWPKLFLQLPAYLIHGFDIRQKYEDNYGRKKLVFQDHQFIPWDLYSDEEINKIGNRLRVPKNIPNRREYIQEKMRKIALQNNTMWMLTAGFATPIMSALICNALEKPVANYLDQRDMRKAEDLLVHFTQEIEKYDFSKHQEQFDKLLADNNGKPITPELFDSIHAKITEGWDPVISTSVRKDLDDFLGCGKYKISKETVDGIHGVIKNLFSGISLSDSELAKILPDADSITDAFNQRNLLNNDTKDFSEHSKVIQDLLDERIEKFIQENPGNSNAKKLYFTMMKMVHSKEKGEGSPLVKVFKLEPAAVLSEQKQDVLRNISKVLDNFKAKNIVLDRYMYIQAAQAPETILANSWNNTDSALLKIMKFTPDEIKQARFDREIAGEILRNKMEEIVANKETYSKFVSEVENLLSTLHGRSSSVELSAANNSGAEDNNLYRSLVNSSCKNAEEAMRAAGMINTAESIVGFDAGAETSLKGLLLNFGTDRVRGVKSSFYRILDMADLYYKVAHVEGLDDILDEKMLREVKEEAVELAKQTILDGHTSDFAVKFYQKRNLRPQMDDYSQITSKDGKVVNKYFGTRLDTDLAEMSNDKNFYEKVMKLMFGSELHPDTYDKIKNSSILEDFKQYRANVLHFIGSDFYFAKPNHLINGVKLEDTPSEYKFALMGCAPDEMFFNLFNHKFNSWKWFNIFGKLGAGLIGVTLLSQFFFGKMKKPEQIKEVK